MRSLPSTVRVLHVDDEPDVADVAATFVEQEDDRFDVETAPSASDGLERLARTAFDCIVSDYEMPGTDGIEFLESVREMHPDLPFILYTGRGGEEVASDAISAGVTEYLQKETGTSQYTVLANRIQNAVEKHYAQRKLADREQRLNLFFEQSPIGILEWNEQFDIVQANDAAEDILGYTESELIGRSWETVVPDSDRDAVAEVVSELPDNADTQYSINKNIRGDGETVLCEWRNRVVTDDNDETVTVFSQFQDVTDRMERTRELEYYEQLTTDIPVGLFRATADGEFISVNDRMADIFNADSIAHLQETRFRSLYETPEDHDRLLQRLSTREEQIEDELALFESVDGKRRICRITLRLVDGSDEQYITGVVQDVTEKRKTEAELKQVKTIANALDDAVYVVDEQGQFEYVNDEFTELTGYDRETILGSTPALIKDQEAVADAETQLGQLLSSEGPDTAAFEVTIRPRNGEPIICEDQMGVLPYQGDYFDGSVGVLRDITDRKQQEERLRRERDRLDEFAGVVSHDLRNPLNVATSSVELAARECDSSHLDRAERAHSRMETLIEDLLTLARGGDQVESPEHIEFQELAESAWGNVSTSDAQLRGETDDGRTLSADRSRLSELLENLYRNAVEHGGEDVTVTVGELAGTSGIYIEDDGPGIPADDRETIFEAGFSTAEDGTGFGLSIVKQVAEAHGWEIQAAASSDGGARFEITGVEFDK